MRKTLLATALGVSVMAMSGCASIDAIHQPQGVANISAARPAAASVDTSVDWHWVVSGDRAVRPLQVFSDNGKTYLQMRPTQALPAVLVDGQPIPFEISTPYLVVQGEPDRMEIVANGFRCVIQHELPPKPAVPPPVTHPDMQRIQRIQLDHQVGMNSARFSSGIIAPAPAATALATAAPEVRALAPAPAPAPAPRHDVLASVAMQTDPGRAWRILPRQKTLSRALQSWAAASGIPVRWKAPVYVPIVRPGEFDGPFMMALGRVLAAASTNRWRFVMYLQGNAVVVNAIEKQA